MYEPSERIVVAAGVDGRSRIRRLAVRGLALSGALLVLAVLLGILLSPPLLLAALPAGLGGLVSFLALVVTNAGAGPRLVPRSLVVEGGAIRLVDPGARAFSIADIAQGWWEDPDRVNLVMKDGRVLVVKVESAAVGDRLLRAAGVTAAERVLRVPLVSAASQIPGGSIFGGVLLAFFGTALLLAVALVASSVQEMFQYVDAGELGAFSIMVAILAVLFFAVYAVASALRRREAVVGTDGIAYKKTLTTEFIPYGALAAVLPDTRGVRLVRRDGRRVLLPTRRAGERPLPLAPPSSPPRTPAEAQRRVLAERIGAAMAAGGARELAQVALDRLDRNGRSREAWREDLGKLLSSEGDYRRALVSPEDLGAVIEDASAPAERRVAAAVALAAREGDEARRRVRIAVRACADEDLQAALEAAAEGEIAEAMLARASSRRA
jgi:hypothetical protein